MKLDNTFEFSVVEIRDLGFTIDENLVATHPEDWITSMDIKFNESENWIQVVVGINFRDELENILASGHVLTRFLVQDLKQYFTPNRKYVLDLPNDYDLTLFSLSFTHSRAILAKNLFGSKYSKVIVPLVNPQEFFMQFRVKREEKKKASRKLKASVKHN